MLIDFEGTTINLDSITKFSIESPARESQVQTEYSSVIRFYGTPIFTEGIGLINPTIYEIFVIDEEDAHEMYQTILESYRDGKKILSLS